jgi:hypothetical protein
MDVPICTPVSLPEPHLLVAALQAVALNPLNQPAPFLAALEPEHLAVLTTRYWGTAGVRLGVAFMEPAPEDLARHILFHMNAWAECCHVEFVPSSQEPHVRVTREGEGYWSNLGTDCLLVPRSRPTMCFAGFTMQTPESEFIRVVRHEAGHALGFVHEHMRADLVRRIDPAKAVAWFGRTQGWDADTVRAQVLTPLEEGSLWGTRAADQQSIMCYQLPGFLTLDGRPITGGVDLDQSDRDFAALVYPLPSGQGPPPPPRMEPVE